MKTDYKTFDMYDCSLQERAEYLFEKADHWKRICLREGKDYRTTTTFENYKRQLEEIGYAYEEIDPTEVAEDGWSPHRTAPPKDTGECGV